MKNMTELKTSMVLLRRTRYPIEIIVDNGSKDPAMLTYLAEIAEFNKRYYQLFIIVQIYGFWVLIQL